MYADNPNTRDSINSDDYAFDVWSDGKVIFVVACCANQFDIRKKNDDGSINKYYRYPIPATSLYDGSAFAWILPLRYDNNADNTGGLNRFGDQFYARETSACNLDAALNPRGIINPRIEWAKVTYGGGESVDSVEVYGFAERVDDGSGEKGYACFKYTGDKNFNLMSDMAIKNALGDDHERVNLRSSVMAKGGAYDTAHRFRCFSFVALSQPKGDAEGKRAIELYDWDMNSAIITFVQGPDFVTLNDTKRQAIVVKEGDIGSFEMVQTVGDDASAQTQTLFYTEAETDGDGAKRYKLKGLRIGNRQSDTSSRSLSYDVMDLTFDVTMPAAGFEVQTVHGTPYIYWLSTVNRQKDGESDPDTWQLWVSVYDPATGTASAPAVFSEFTLESGLVPRDALLTTDGQGYLTVTPVPKEDDEKTPPMTLYSFPLTLKPVLTVSAMILEDSTVSAGDFEDATIALMNEGNMGISAFDLELYTQAGDAVNVVETLHCDCLNPENSSLTMQGGGQQAILRKGKQAIYRNDDFDYTTRQRDWVLGEKQLKLEAKQSGSDGPWTGSLSERDATSQYVKSNMLMPGALASFTGALKIPENWSGDRTLYLRVSNVYTYANWQGAMAKAADVKGPSGVTSNAAGAKGPTDTDTDPAVTQLLTWSLNGSGDKLELQQEGLTSALTDAVSSRVIASAVKAGQPASQETDYHDIEISNRIYADGDGDDLVDIVISNFADSDDSFRLTCAVYLDNEKEPTYFSLPYYEMALANRTTHTITLPVAALVDDPEAHNSARVVILAVGRDECAYANNEFTIYLGGNNPLRFVKQPVDAVIQEGENVAFAVEVTGGTKPYQYQWQAWDKKHEKWVNLPGYTQAILSRENVKKKWNGLRVRCAVTDAAETTIVSDPATLTVRAKVPTGDHTHLPLYLAVALIALALFVLTRRRAKG